MCEKRNKMSENRISSDADQKFVFVFERKEKTDICCFSQQVGWKITFSSHSTAKKRVGNIFVFVAFAQQSSHNYFSITPRNKPQRSIASI